MTIQRHRIALIVDNPNRDLLGMVLVAHYLARRGHDVFLVPFNLQIQEVWNLVPNVVLVNYLRGNNEEFVREMMEAGISVCVHDTEGGVFFPLPSGASGKLREFSSKEIPLYEAYAVAMSKDKLVRSQIFGYCSWNPDFAEYAVRRDWYSRDQMVVTGVPRIDAYSRKWSRAIRRLASTYIESKRPFILINGSFVLANPRFNSPEQEMRILYEQVGYAEDYVRQWHDNQLHAMRELTSVVNHLADIFSDVTFVYRPHPFECASTYRYLLDARDNVCVRGEGTVDGWLLQSKAMIHWGSSTALDAVLANVPVIRPGWIPEHLPIPTVDAVTMRPSNMKQLTILVESILSGHNQQLSFPEKRHEIVESCYSKLDGCAHERVGEVLLNGLEQGLQVCRSACKENAYRVHEYGVPRTRRILRKTRLYTGLPIHWSFKHCMISYSDNLSWDSSEKKFGVDDVVEICRAIEDSESKNAKRIVVANAQEAGAYYHGFREGRSVKVSCCD